MDESEYAINYNADTGYYDELGAEDTLLRIHVRRAGPSSCGIIPTASRSATYSR